MEIISQEDGKVRRDGNIIIKKSNDLEYQNLIIAKQLIENLAHIKIEDKEYTLKVPNILNYKNNEIFMEFCNGENLELILREKKHNLGVLFTNELLKHFINNKVYWKDFAPRNILIENNVINFVDFERGFLDTDKSVREYLEDLVYEEYSAFLLPEERFYKEEDLFHINENKIIALKDIKSKRIRTILETLGFKEECKLSDYYLAIKIILENEKPYYKGKEIIFPLVEIEDYLTSEGYHKYAKKMIGDYYGKGRKI